MNRALLNTKLIAWYSSNYISSHSIFRHCYLVKKGHWEGLKHCYFLPHKNCLLLCRYCCLPKKKKKKSKPTAWKHWQIYSYRHHAHICQKHKCSSQCIVIEAIIIFFATNGTIRWTCFSELQLQNDQTNLRKLQQKADTAENIHKK